MKKLGAFPAVWAMSVGALVGWYVATQSTWEFGVIAGNFAALIDEIFEYVRHK